MTVSDREIHMAKTAAERQADYRQRRPTAGDNGERRINMWISTGAALALDRLARRYGVTKREMIERLVCADDNRIVASLELESPDWDVYFGNPARTSVTL